MERVLTNVCPIQEREEIEERQERDKPHVNLHVSRSINTPEL